MIGDILSSARRAGGPAAFVVDECHVEIALCSVIRSLLREVPDRFLVVTASAVGDKLGGWHAVIRTPDQGGWGERYGALVFATSRGSTMKFRSRLLPGGTVTWLDPGQAFAAGMMQT